MYSDKELVMASTRVDSISKSVDRARKSIKVCIVQLVDGMSRRAGGAGVVD